MSNGRTKIPTLKVSQLGRRRVEARELRSAVERDPDRAVGAADDLRRLGVDVGEDPAGDRGSVRRESQEIAAEEVRAPDRAVGVEERVGEARDRLFRVGRAPVDEGPGRRVEVREGPVRFGEPEGPVGPLHEGGRPAGRVGPLGELGRGGVEAGDLEASELRDPESSVGLLEEVARRRVARHRPLLHLLLVRGDPGEDVLVRRCGPDGAVGLENQVRGVVAAAVRDSDAPGRGRDRYRRFGRRA